MEKNVRKRAFLDFFWIFQNSGLSLGGKLEHTMEQ